MSYYPTSPTMTRYVEVEHVSKRSLFHRSGTILINFSVKTFQGRKEVKEETKKEAYQQREFLSCSQQGRDESGEFLHAVLPLKKGNPQQLPIQAYKHARSEEIRPTILKDCLNEEKKKTKIINKLIKRKKKDKKTSF